MNPACFCSTCGVVTGVAGADLDVGAGGGNVMSRPGIVRAGGAVKITLKLEINISLAQGFGEI